MPGRRASGVDEVFEALNREAPPRVKKTGGWDPPPETGRNPEATAVDMINGALLIPQAIAAFVAVFLLSGYLRVALAPPATVPLSEALSALISIEDDYAAAGPRIGLRQRVTGWFKWAALDRRLPVELEGLDGPARSRAEERGRSALEFLASVVEYSGYSANGVGDPYETGRMADRLAQEQASMGYADAEAFSAEALAAGRKALQEALQVIADARAQADGAA